MVVKYLPKNSNGVSGVSDILPLLPNDAVHFDPFWDSNSKSPGQKLSFEAFWKKVKLQKKILNDYFYILCVQCA